MLENRKCGVSAALAADVGDSERYEGGELKQVWETLCLKTGRHQATDS